MRGGGGGWVGIVRACSEYTGPVYNETAGRVEYRYI